MTRDELAADVALQQDIESTAHALAEAARAAILPYFRGDALDTIDKGDKIADGGYDPVTVADRAAETAMRAVLAERRPVDAIIGEEHGATPGTSGLTWVLDPIDGTRGFVAGTPTWGVLIACSTATGPVFGMIDQPYIGERFWGGFGQARMQGPQGARALGVKGEGALDAAILFTTFPEVGTAQEGAAFRAVAERVRMVRYGMDCYAYALLAAGQVDLVIEAGLSNYDIQAPIALIEAAGGIVTDWQGGPAHEGGRVIAAAGEAQHDAALQILRQVAG
ncbi:inositol monophosphatase family protein [Rhodalgimonas zhirmunskyi]|uniref:Inositol monophosphatase family protein n=1 Tax=Rhodalgimonas zhirmunskyi TaxID=2964767 RepID=A0AAJ1U750_9RHOB|nr:inositol monophosphatase family protein [Rhodoalgimonas zhirmunskyi]MDQ2094795.1 inositol monophosphatase family protein [Rhodoalgimonas zhirmunskyi]